MLWFELVSLSLLNGFEVCCRYTNCSSNYWRHRVCVFLWGRQLEQGEDGIKCSLRSEPQFCGSVCIEVGFFPEYCRQLALDKGVCTHDLHSFSSLIDIKLQNPGDFNEMGRFLFSCLVFGSLFVYWLLVTLVSHVHFLCDKNTTEVGITYGVYL